MPLVTPELIDAFTYDLSRVESAYEMHYLMAGVGVGEKQEIWFALPVKTQTFLKGLV